MSYVGERFWPTHAETRPTHTTPPSPLCSDRVHRGCWPSTHPFRTVLFPRKTCTVGRREFHGGEERRGARVAFAARGVQSGANPNEMRTWNESSSASRRGGEQGCLVLQAPRIVKAFVKTSGSWGVQSPVPELWSPKAHLASPPQNAVYACISHSWAWNHGSSLRTLEGHFWINRDTFSTQQVALVFALKDQKGHAVCSRNSNPDPSHPSSSSQLSICSAKVHLGVTGTWWARGLAF